MNSEKFNLSMGNFSDKYLSEREKSLRSKSQIKIFTLEEVQSFVMNQSVSDEIKRDLLALLNKYPHAAYNNFIENINKNIQVIMKKRTEYIKNNNPNYKSKTERNKVKEISFQNLDEEINQEIVKSENQISFMDINDQIQSDKVVESDKSILDELKQEFE